VAVALLKDHPEMSARKLAKQCGCAPSTLTRSALFKTAKGLATGKRDRHRGWKDADEAIEAVADDD
jgi:DNA-binding MurR/RpiR family transcriptional regulator